MGELVFACPHCRKTLSAHNNLSGRTVTCPRCGGAIRLSPPEPPPPSHATAAASSTVPAPPRTASPKDDAHAPRQRAGPILATLGTIVGGIVMIAVVVWCPRVRTALEVFVPQTPLRPSSENRSIGPSSSRPIEDISGQAGQEMHRIEQDAIADAIKQYEIVKRSGSALEASVHAGLIAGLYLQAKDEANYMRWRSIERQEARRAGMRLD